MIYFTLEQHQVSDGWKTKSKMLRFDKKSPNPNTKSHWIKWDGSRDHWYDPDQKFELLVKLGKQLGIDESTSYRRTGLTSKTIGDINSKEGGTYYTISFYWGENKVEAKQKKEYVKELIDALVDRKY